LIAGWRTYDLNGLSRVGKSSKVIGSGSEQSFQILFVKPFRIREPNLPGSLKGRLLKGWSHATLLAPIIISTQLTRC